MTDAPAADPTVLLSNQPAGLGECRFAGAVIAGSTLIFVVLVPLARLPLPGLPAFIAFYQSALLINDLITAVFLIGQSQFSRSNALGLLAGGYLFTALMSIAHALTFPGLFSDAGLLGAGAQTTAWLYMFWHGGFPLFVIAYATHDPNGPPSWRADAAVVVMVVPTAALVIGFTLLATVGQGLLPAIMHDNRYTPALIVVVSAVWMLNLIAVFVLSRRRPYGVLDVWLIVAMCAWLFDIALSAVFNAGRYDLGFYAGRIYGLAAASLVLVILLLDNGRLYLQLIRLREADREKAAVLHHLSTIDPLTGIANRRAFEDALGQEWRRMMRHSTALSLLMIDVDYFKRFNDTYGHVNGDHCLRTVAQSLTRWTRRAGEMAARYGGEEFAVLLPHCDLAEASKLAGLICAGVREQKIPHAGSAVAPYVTISIGVASMAQVPHIAAAMSRDGAAPTLPAAATILIEAADQALYQAKMAGRNRVAAAGDREIAAATAEPGGPAGASSQTVASSARG